MTFTIYLPQWALALIAIVLVVWLYIDTWTHFLALYHLKKVEKARAALGLPPLPPASRFLGYWVLLPRGLVLDCMLNMVASFAFLDLPREFLLTARLQRYADGPDGWRRRRALALDADQIDPYDKGHIKKPEDQGGTP